MHWFQGEMQHYSSHLCRVLNMLINYKQCEIKMKCIFFSKSKWQPPIDREWTYRQLHKIHRYSERCWVLTVKQSGQQGFTLLNPHIRVTLQCVNLFVLTQKTTKSYQNIIFHMMHNMSSEQLEFLNLCYYRFFVERKYNNQNKK